MAADNNKKMVSTGGSTVDGCRQKNLLVLGGGGGGSTVDGCRQKYCLVWVDGVGGGSTVNDCRQTEKSS